jgi:hypothetical protein
MRIRVYKYDGRITRSILHATCVATFDLSPKDFYGNHQTLAEEHDGDFITVNELDTDPDDPELTE